MKLLTRDTDYAVRALCCIAGKKGAMISAAKLVKELKVPRPFLRKILQTLSKKGLIASYKGIGGGFKIAAMPGKITLAGLIEIFQGPLRLNECLLKKKECPNKKMCPLKKQICRVERYVISELRSITLASLI